MNCAQKSKAGPFLAWLVGTVVTLCLPGLLPRDAEAGEGSVNAANGDVDFNVHFRFPPTSQQLVDVREAVDMMALGVCDATEAQMRVRQVTFSQGAPTEDQGDFWIHALPGRSGVSFFADGSGLGRLGTHVDMLSGAILVPDVYLHEFGHLAFGLGDEYDEQSRWGGPCGIGPSFDAGTMDEQNHSIMQQAGSAQCVGGPTPGVGCRNNAQCGAGGACQFVLMSELSVNANHDPLVGDGNNCPAVTAPAMKCPDDAYCQRVWNSGTSRYERTQQSELHNGDADWETLDQNYPFVTPPANRPVAAAPVACNRPVTYVNNVVGSDQVLLMLDKSGSMSWSSVPGQNEVCANGADDDGDGSIDEADCANARITFVRAAANAYLDLQVGNAVDVGIMSFNDGNSLDRQIGTLNAGNLAAYKAIVDGILPGGNTGIGDALSAAIPEFNRVFAAGRSRTAYLMTDGINTSGSDPDTGATALRNIGVRIHTIPAGSDVDEAELSGLALSSGGQMYPVPSANELIGVYAELAARHRGAALTLPRLNFRLARRGESDSNNPDPMVPVPERDFPFLVEKNAKALVGFVATRNGRLSDWNVQIELHGPNGEVFGPGSPQLKVTPAYLFLNVIAPAPGHWRLLVRANGTAVQEGTAVVFVDNPDPDFFLDVRPRNVQVGESAKVSLAPLFVTALDDAGVTVTAELIRPDGSRAPLAVVRTPGRGYAAETGALAMNGLYRVEGKLSVDASAQPARGESIFDGPERPPVAVPAFQRTAQTSFAVVGGRDFPCLDPAGLDCDLDTIPDSRECLGYPADIDGDGRPNGRDTDADGDEIPDSVEGMRDMDRNQRPDMCEKSPLRSAPPPRSPVDDGLAEGDDCVRISPMLSAVRQVGRRWTISQENVVHYDFGRDAEGAKRALRLLRAYGITHLCRIGRPTPRWMYLLADGELPRGAQPGERCRPLDVRALAAAGPQGEALLRQHRLSLVCTIGEASPAFQYFRN